MKGLGYTMDKRVKHIKKNYKKYHSVYHRRRQLNMKRIVICVMVFLVLTVFVVKGITLLVSSGDKSVEVVQNNVNQKDGESFYGESETKKQQKVKKTEVSIIAVGDNLVSDSVLATAKRNGGGKYDFSSVFEKMKPDFQAADIAIINQETMLGGNQFEYQGYPLFNTPDSMGRAVIDAGFDIVQCASNHSLDTKVTGMKHAIKFWKKNKDKIMMVGLNENEEEYNKIPIYECKGIKFAVLNYTYGLNGLILPEEYSYMVNLMDDKHWDKVKADIEKA